LDKKREGREAVNTRCVLVKLADRLANIRECVKNNPRLLDMYLKEQDTFKAALIMTPSQTSPVLERMWAEYDQLLEGKDAK
jgi:hypothetical protein